MGFDYYYGTQAEQFTFIRIPRHLITGEAFKGLSLQSKMLYGLLLDRMGLSMRNEWLDDENRVYIIYQVSEIAEDLCVSQKTAIDYLAELESFGLVSKKRRGRGLPSLLYVKNFIQEQQGVFLPDQEMKDLQDKKCRDYSSRSEDSTVQEVKKPTALKNYNNINYNNINHINQSINPDDKGLVDTANEVFEAIEKQIEYDILVERHPEDEELIGNIVDLMAEVEFGRRKTFKISGADYSAAFVRARFRRLTAGHVRHVVTQLRENVSDIRNIKAYILAMLFNVVAIDKAYYTAKASHDLTVGFSGGADDE